MPQTRSAFATNFRQFKCNKSCWCCWLDGLEAKRVYTTYTQGLIWFSICVVRHKTSFDLRVWLPPICTRLISTQHQKQKSLALVLIDGLRRLFDILLDCFFLLTHTPLKRLVLLHSRLDYHLFVAWEPNRNSLWMTSAPTSLEPLPSFEILWPCPTAFQMFVQFNEKRIGKCFSQCFCTTWWWGKRDYLKSKRI